MYLHQHTCTKLTENSNVYIKIYTDQFQRLLCSLSGFHNAVPFSFNKLCLRLLCFWSPACVAAFTLITRISYPFHAYFLFELWDFPAVFLQMCTHHTGIRILSCLPSSLNVLDLLAVIAVHTHQHGYSYTFVLPSLTFYRLAAAVCCIFTRITGYRIPSCLFCELWIISCELQYIHTHHWMPYSYVFDFFMTPRL